MTGRTNLLLVSTNTLLLMFQQLVPIITERKNKTVEFEVFVSMQETLHLNYTRQ